MMTVGPALSWITCRQHFRWRFLERALMVLLVMGGIYLYLTVPDIRPNESSRLNLQPSERDIPIYFAIANRTNQNHAKINSKGDNIADLKPNFAGKQVEHKALPMLLPKEDDQVKTESKTKPEPIKKPAPPVEKAKIPVPPTEKTKNPSLPAEKTQDSKPKQDPKQSVTKPPPVSTPKPTTKAEIKTLFSSKTSPLSWLPNEKISDTGSDEVTLVTAYINIGKYSNDDNKLSYTPDAFRKWMGAFSRIRNPVIVYMNDGNDLQMFHNIRTMVPDETLMYKLSKELLWSFSLLPNITAVYSSYPRNNPITLVPHYTSVSLAKYELMAMALKENPFKTKYFAWIDIGYFRSMVKEVLEDGPPFTLYLPPMLDQNKIAYGQTTDIDHDLTPEKILKNRHTWISGSMFIGKASTMKKWILQFVKYAEKFLQERLISVDQHIIYAMFRSEEELPVNIQTYSGQGLTDTSHHFGLICKDEGARKSKMSDVKSSKIKKK